MKRILYILPVLISLQLVGQDQKEKSNGKLDSIKAVYPQRIRTIVKTNPAALFIGVMPVVTSEYRLLLEFPSAPLQSSQIGFSYLGKSPFIRIIENDTLKKNPNAYYLRMYITGFRFQASYRFFLNKWLHTVGLSYKPVYSPRGFYISPHFSYSTAKITYKFANQYDIYFQVNQFNVNLLGGCQFTMFRKIAVDMFAGIGYKKNEWLEHEQNVTRVVTPPKDLEIPGYFSPVKFTVGMNFGYCF